MNNLVGDVKANPRDFYRYINSQKKDTQGIPPLKKRQGSGLAQSDFEKASEFNGQFTDVFTKSIDAYKKSFFPQSIRDWNVLPDSLISSAELSDDCVSKFTSLVRARD